MKTFSDNLNRTWELKLNMFQVKRIKDETGFDLLDAKDGEIFEWTKNLQSVFDIIWVLIKGQNGNETIEDFGTSMDGDKLDLASQALLEEVINFFPQSKRQPLMNLKTKVVNHLEKQMAAANAAIENLTEDDLKKILEMNTN